MKGKNGSLIMFVVIVLLFAGSVALYFFAFNWIKVKNEYISRLSGDLLTEANKKEQQKKVEKAIEETDASRATLSSYFVPGDQAVSFLETLESYGATAGATLKFTSVDYDSASSSLNMVFHITGNFQSVYHDILLLENAPYEFKFNRIAMTRQDPLVQSGKNPEIVLTPTWRADVNVKLQSFIKK